MVERPNELMLIKLRVGDPNKVFVKEQHHVFSGWRAMLEVLHFGALRTPCAPSSPFYSLFLL